MDEARRFLRLVIPGLVFGVEVVILILLLRPDKVDRLNELLAKDSGLAVLSAGLLGSGALGFIFSSIHHEWLALSKGDLMDRRPVLQRLVDKPVLKLRGTKEPHELTHQEAWIILTALWHERTGGSDGGQKIKNMETRAKDLMDLAHSLGTVRVATVIAPFVAILLATKGGVFPHAFVNVLLFVVAVIFESTLLYVFFDGYERTALIAQSVIDQVLSDALDEESKKPTDATDATSVRVIETWPLLSPLLKESLGVRIMSKIRKLFSK